MALTEHRPELSWAALYLIAAVPSRFNPEPPSERRNPGKDCVAIPAAYFTRGRVKYAECAVTFPDQSKRDQFKDAFAAPVTVADVDPPERCASSAPLAPADACWPPASTV